MAPSLKMPREKNVFRRTINALSLISVEPYAFFCLFGYVIRVISFQSLLMERACTNLHMFPDEICNDLDNHTTHQVASIEAGNNLYSGVMLLGSLPAIVVAIFLGPWSDKYSRKYPLMIAASGLMLESSVSAALTFFPEVSPYWYVVASVFAGLSGGFIMSVSSAFSYMADVTDERSRPARYAVLEFSNIFAIILGSVLGGQIFKAGGYSPVMIMAPCSFGLAILYTAFVVKETKKRPPELTCSVMLRDLVTLDNIKESFKTCTRKRPGNIRLQIWLLVWASCSQKFVDMGTLAVAFPFSRQMYKWDVTDFSQATTLFFVGNAVATIVIVPFLSNKLRLHEAALGLIGMLSLTSKMVVCSVAEYEGLFYFAWLSGALNNSAAIAIRSRLSKLVNKDELGRAFSLLGTCESVTPLLGTLVFVQLFNASVLVFPGLPFAFSAVLLIPSVLIFMWMNKLPTIALGEYGRDSRSDMEPKEMSSSNYVTLKEEKL